MEMKVGTASFLCRLQRFCRLFCVCTYSKFNQSVVKKPISRNLDEKGRMLKYLPKKKIKSK